MNITLANSDTQDPDPSRTFSAKCDRLVDILANMQTAAIAFSGGVDSSVVAKAAVMALGTAAVAVTADSPSVSRAELADAERLAKIIGIRHLVVPTEEFTHDEYLKNDGTRCYHCKSELYSRIESLLPTLGTAWICSGANLDDLGDYRPGLIAAAEHHVRHPLQEAGFGKADVRMAARAWNLPVWDKPASPCLSSRVVPGLAVTRERIGRIEQAEEILHDLELRECRVRCHEGDLARIEVPASAIARLADDSIRPELARRLREIGFRFITLDLEGFRSGNLNELISLELKSRHDDRIRANFTK